MSIIGQVRKVSNIQYGSCGQLYAEDYESIINAYNTRIDEEDCIYCNSDESKWEFRINDVEKLIQYFDSMDDYDLEIFSSKMCLYKSVKEIRQFVTDMKNWLEDGKQTGQNYIIIDWF